MTVGKNAAIEVDGVAYWMSTKGFAFEVQLKRCRVCRGRGV